jgi:tetratricopeptide (TPR) repeat protein
LFRGTLGPGNFLSKFLGDLNGSIYDLSCDYGSGGGSGSCESNYRGNSLNLDIFTGMEKLATFQEYTESFPLTLNEFLSSKNCECEGVINVIPLEDLKVISNGNSNNMALLWIEVAKVYLQEGLLQDSEAALSQAYQNNEIFAPIFAAFALIEEAKNSFDEAEKFYRKGLSIDSEDETCLLGLARVHLRSQNPSKLFESESMIHRLLRIDPNIAEAWSILAQCCFQTGRNEDALKYFEIALKKESTAPLRSIRSISIY